jgi:hypothetical protein
MGYPYSVPCSDPRKESNLIEKADPIVMEFWRAVGTMICTAPSRMEASSRKATRPPTSETSTLNTNREPRRVLMIERALTAGFNAQCSEPGDRGANCGATAESLAISKASRLLHSTTRPLWPNSARFLGLVLGSWDQNSSGSTTDMERFTDGYSRPRLSHVLSLLGLIPEMRPLTVTERMRIFSAISTTRGAAAASSNGPSTMGTLDGEGTVIDCSRPNILIPMACDSESFSVHMDWMGGNTRHFLPNAKVPHSLAIVSSGRPTLHSHLIPRKRTYITKHINLFFMIH